MHRRVIAMALMLLCVLGLVWGGQGSVAFAETPPVEGEGALSGDVTLLKRENDKFIMQVTVENKGEDFTGTVQVIFGSDYDNCAYQTQITLPAQGKKQFTVTVPERAMDTVYGICALNFLDEKGKELQSIPISDVLGSMLAGIPVGILSDDYTSLTFMDAGGDPFYIRGINYPLNLVELNNENLTGYLDGLYFLVIDQFNMASLSKENIQAIQDWVKGGGWLMIGTGAYAEQTLSGFDEDFLDIDVTGISEPGEENVITSKNIRNGYYYNYEYDAGIDFTQMAVAELNYSRMLAYGGLSESPETPAVIFSVEDGAVSVLYFSLSEKELQKMNDYMIQTMYEELMYSSNSYNTFYGARDMEYIGRRALAYIDSRNSNVDFTWLKVLIVIYVVLVGPVLYLILRKCKKSEWYWVGVPALGMLFILGVFVFGQGIKVRETRVYSVTVQQADGSLADTYFLAYKSGVKPWMMRLNDKYEMAGPGFQGYSYYYSSASVKDYHYIVGNDGKGLSVGLKPTSNFENGFLYAEGRAERKGSFAGVDLKGFGSSGNVSGFVTNDTICDMAYMAVWANSYILVFSDVKAGESIDIQQAIAGGRCVYQSYIPYFDMLLQDMVGLYRARRDYAQDDMAALLIGLGIADERRQSSEYAVIAGVVKDYDKAVADDCMEISYGCLYSYVQAGVETADDDGQTATGR